MTTFDDMLDFVKSAWPARKYIVPCLEGPAGIGKTAAIEQAAKDLGAGKVVTIIASQILPNEVSGITMPVVESKAMEIFDHYRLASLKDGDILFFDELLEADELVLSACLTLIESRRLMSGRQLPDIMIVAATNPTIKPNMLKENIRQRFVWKKFHIDKTGTRQYIMDSIGFDPTWEVVNEIVTTGNEYNILTPRSLTKMCQWIKDSDGEAADTIDTVWHSQLGTKLRAAYKSSAIVNDVNARRAASDAVFEVTGQRMSFEDSTMEELLDILQGMPEWEEIAAKLSEPVVEDDECAVTF